MSFNLATILTEATLAAPDAPACRFAGTTTTYRELDELSGRFAAGLRAAGLGPGQVVAMQLPNIPHFLIGYFGALKAGLVALPADIDGALVCLADMPRVDPHVLDRLISAFNPMEGRAICLPVWEGKRGNPVLWARRFFPEMGSLAGDMGARHLIGQYAELVAEVPMPDDAVLLDIDTPEALAVYRQRPA